MLSGYQPFYAPYVGELITLIKKGEFDFVGPVWDRVSNNAKDLIVKLLQTDPDKRINVHGALAHPWFTQTGHTDDGSFDDDHFRSNLVRNQRRLTRNFFPSLVLAKRVSDASCLQKISRHSNLLCTATQSKRYLEKF
jgi:serine/threonine protein kinase